MSTILSVKSALKDDWRHWPAEYCKAPEFDRAGYQNKLDEIAGLSRGRSVLRLEWGGEEQVARYGALDFMSAKPSELVYEPKYKLRREYLGSKVLVPFRRWVIAELMEWEEYAYHDNDSGTMFTDEQGVLRRAADKPRDLYTPLIYVGDHRLCKPDCCAEKICPGDYKAPDAAELFWVLESTYKLKTERIKDPRQKDFTDAQKKQIAAEWGTLQTQKRTELKEKLEYIEL